jgi:Helix-turn-helix domain
MPNSVGASNGGEMSMKKTMKSRDQLLTELRSAYERGASIRTLVASTGRSYGSIHSMLRESGTTMRSRGGPNHRSRRAS